MIRDRQRGDDRHRGHFQGLGFRVLGSRFWVQGSGFWPNLPLLPGGLNKDHGQPKGFALVLVMAIVLMLEVICLFLAQARGTQTHLAYQKVKKLKARYLAEAGLAHGLWRIQEDPNWRVPLDNLPLGDGHYTATLTQNPNQPFLLLKSCGEIGNIPYSTQQKIHQVTIQPKNTSPFLGQDTFIVEGDKNTEYDHEKPAELWLDSEKVGGTRRCRTLVRFPLEQYALPPKAEIIAARFSLYLYEAAQSFSGDVYRVHSLSKRFIDPFASPRLPLETTWLYRYDGEPWDDPTKDEEDIHFDSPSEDERVFTQLGWQTWRATKMTRIWIDNPALNHGLILEADPSGGNKEFKFSSSAYAADPTLAPRLTVYYLDKRSP